MNNLRQILIIPMLFLTMVVCFGQDKKAHNVDNSNIALEGYSAVSYLDLGIAQKGVKDFKSEHKKIIYYFTSAIQKTAFDKNPERYLPQYGGFCAFGIYAGAKFRADPNKFLVKDGKYYLFLYNLELDAQQLWLAEKNHNKLAAAADEKWKKLRATYN